MLTALSNRFKQSLILDNEKGKLKVGHDFLKVYKIKDCFVR